MATALTLSSAAAIGDEAESDYAAHLGTYQGFLHLLRWCVAHVLIMLVGLYVAVMQSNGPPGALIMAIGVVLLAYGVLSIRRIRREAKAAAVATER